MKINCPECGAPAAGAGDPFPDGAGRIVQPLRCGKCRFAWSVPAVAKAMAGLPAVASAKEGEPAAPEVAAPPAPEPAAPDVASAPPAAIPAPVEPEPPTVPFDADSVQEGDRIRYLWGPDSDEEVGRVNGATPYTVLVEIEDEPDRRVTRSRILGLAE